MLQIIGWIGCLYLVVKALEIISNSAFRGEDGNLRSYANLACWLAFVGAAFFAIWLYDQGTNGPSIEADDIAEVPAPPHEDVQVKVNDCTASAKNDEEMRACNAGA